MSKCKCNSEKVVYLWDYDGNEEKIKEYTDKGYRVIIPINGQKPLKDALRQIIFSRYS